jgi:hypothetical protein
MCGYAPGIPRPAFSLLRAVLSIAVVLSLAAQGPAQGPVSFTQRRPFVVGIIPVVNRGAVGGVSIDAQGLLARSDLDQLGRLREARLKALQITDTELQTASPLRKVSLRGLLAEIERRRIAGEPVGDDLQNLAGLVRVRLVLVYPEHADIVLAGPADGWKVDEQGNLVGRTTGRPLLQLDDLIVALRTARSAATGDGITCSINPTPAGLKQFERLMRSPNLPAGEATVARLEQSLGPQQVSVTGVPPESHFAQVMVAADFLMKRLAMNFEPPPIDGLPSYLELLQASSGNAPRSAMPRFWMAPRYEPLLVDDAGLAYEIRGGSVKAMTEQGFLGRGGELQSARGKEDPQARKWAETMTAKYDELSAAMPIFAELRNCIDLAVVAALLTKEDLPGRAGLNLSPLLDDKTIQVAQYQAPQSVASRASLVRKGRQWIVSISGGVDIDSWSVLDSLEQDLELAKLHQASAPIKLDRWWWD